MLRLENIKKDYIIGKNIPAVHALKDITINFRKSEFVSILGPSGCGKTTLLNIIGGLDKYTSGNLIISNKSTKKFKDRDWDIYRNHRVGFIFQSYNLIPHQNILSNVELSLNIAGIKKQERIKRAKEVLDKVGLKDLYYKKPNQLSGGQCQRVAIARALVNNPEILLADEPTGALDTKTSVQIMELIKEISKDRLVIMVTHNPDLAKTYSTRIVNLLDGNIIDDSNPYLLEDELKENNAIKKNEKAKMKAYDAFRLSFKNLISKGKRTTMTAFAGSIGIIGVSLVLSISTGINSYIDNMQNDMLSGNPITISTSTYDLSKLTSMTSTEKKAEIIKEEGLVNVNSIIERLMKNQDALTSLQIKNELTEDYVNYINNMDPSLYASIMYDYGMSLKNNIYTSFKVDENSSEEYMSISTIIDTYNDILKKTDYGIYSSYVTSLASVISQAPDNEDYIKSQYNIKSGKIATKANELMIVINSDNELTDLVLAELGYLTEDEFLNITYRAANDEKYNADKDIKNYSYESLLNKKFVLYKNDDVYTKNDLTKLYSYDAYKDNLNDSFIEFEIVGILEPKDTISYGCLEAGFYYTKDLVNQVLEDSLNSNIVKDMINTINDDENKDALTYSMLKSSCTNQPILKTDTNSYSYLNISYLSHHYFPEDGVYVKYEDTISSPHYVGTSSSSFTTQSQYNMTMLSINNIGGSQNPDSISIYPTDFEKKNEVINYLDKWNDEIDLTINDKVLTYSERKEVKYTDTLSIIIAMIKNMINIVSAALIAFTALSLVVSTVMIGIITYVSVVERTKEIGVIRSIGGRKKDVSLLFIAETFIIGLFAGLVGIGITYLLSAVLNIIIKVNFDIYPIAKLLPTQAIIMITISVLLTLISGLMPAKAAAKRDPVIALRSE